MSLAKTVSRPRTRSKAAPVVVSFTMKDIDVVIGGVIELEAVALFFEVIGYVEPGSSWRGHLEILIEAGVEALVKARCQIDVARNAIHGQLATRRRNRR